MDLEYVQSESTIKPQLIEVRPEIVYLRKDITSRVDNQSAPPTTIYTYKEAQLSIEQFNAHANKLLMTGQEDANNNQLAIMEAFADLYETMTMGIEGDLQ